MISEIQVDVAMIIQIIDNAIIVQILEAVGQQEIYKLFIAFSFFYET